MNTTNTTRNAGRGPRPARPLAGPLRAVPVRPVPLPRVRHAGLPCDLIARASQ